MQHALARRQLLLVLDLDHTLLNSARFIDLTQEQGEMLQELEKELHVEYGADRLLKRFDHMAMWTKLRPYVRYVRVVWCNACCCPVVHLGTHLHLCREFLHQVSQLFELYIYTMGDRDYAAEMAAFLDPRGQYFRGRVISKVFVWLNTTLMAMNICCQRISECQEEKKQQHAFTTTVATITE